MAVTSTTVPGPEPGDCHRALDKHFGDFWYPSNKFYASAAGITSGEVVMIAEGHPWAAIITFGAAQDEAGTVARIDLLVTANDPSTR